MYSWPDRRLALPPLLALLMMPLASSGARGAEPGHFGYGTPATAEQIAGWDIDVRPDGAGLPPGEGSVAEGEVLYETQCADCHGTFGEGARGYPALAGGQGSLTDARPKKTVGSYWAHVSTLWDYVHRAMPFNEPASLDDDEVYAVTAYVLYLNDVVDADFVLTRGNLPTLRLPNAGNFVADARPDTSNSRCMSGCKDPATVAVQSEAPAFVPSPRAAALASATSQIEAGREIAADRNRGNCYSCHQVEGAEMAGNAGPPLVQMRLRYPDREALKAQIFDARTRNPDTVMPPYGAHGILTDHELERVVDYVHSL